MPIISTNLVGGFNPSEKYENQLGLLFMEIFIVSYDFSTPTTNGQIKHVPNHQWQQCRSPKNCRCATPKPSTRVLSLYPSKGTKKGIKGDGTVIYQDLSRTLSSYLFCRFPIVFNSPSICLQRPKPPTTLDTKS